MMPIVLSLKVQKGKPILRGQDHYWSVIMQRDAAGQTFTIQDIHLSSNSDRASIKDFVRRLLAGGLIEKTDGSGTRQEYRPLIKQSLAPRVRRDGTIIESLPATQCMWNLMRGPTGRNGFTYRDLVHWGSTDETVISANTAKTYISILKTAGYLIMVRASVPGTPAIWRLDPKMNFGPKAPMILRTKLVFDPNKGDVMGPAPAEEVSP